jgi:hypothetical protein
MDRESLVGGSSEPILGSRTAGGPLFALVRAIDDGTVNEIAIGASLDADLT